MIFETDDALLILGSLSQRSMDIWELSTHLQLEQDISWTNLEADRVHKILRILQRDQLIEWTPSNTSRGGIYQITGTGKSVLAGWLRKTLTIKRHTTFPFDLLVNALGVLSIEERLHLIVRRKAAIISHLERLDTVANELPDQKVIPRAIVHHHQIYLQAELKWLDELDTYVDKWDFETDVPPDGSNE